MDLKDKTILITGGARVGQQVVEELKKDGAKIVMTYWQDETEVHPQAKGYQLDITSEEQIKSVFGKIEKEQGQVDGLVNMASVFWPDEAEVTFANIHKQFLINTYGNMLLSRLFALSAKKRQAEAAPIVSFIDWAVDHPYKNYDVYIASKAALRHYLMALQTSFAGFIRVVNIHPGLILEPEGFPTAEREKIVANTPTKLIGTPQQAAKLVRIAFELDFLADNIRLAGGQQWRHRL